MNNTIQFDESIRPNIDSNGDFELGWFLGGGFGVKID
jgi:hypothetical protein